VGAGVSAVTSGAAGLVCDCGVPADAAGPAIAAHTSYTVGT
jgi:hypothetical protein